MTRKLVRRAASGSGQRRGLHSFRKLFAAFRQLLVDGAVRRRHARGCRSGGRRGRLSAARFGSDRFCLLARPRQICRRPRATGSALALQRLASDLDGVLGSAWQASGNLAPLVADLGLHLDDDFVLLRRVGALVDRRVQVVAPALTALFGCPACAQYSGNRDVMDHDHQQARKRASKYPRDRRDRATCYAYALTSHTIHQAKMKR